MADVPPIHCEILVPTEAPVAFDVFTSRIGSWWPLGDFSVHGDGTVAFRDGAIVETAADGRTAVWGTVTEWTPPHRLAFTWHPGTDASRASQVTVTFAGAGAQTLVALQHDGWDVFDDPAGAREEYDHGWPTVLDRFRTAFTDAATWVALVHRPANVLGSAVFDDQRFPEHVAFLRQMRQRGYLVAAGPLGDEAGAGMTILKLPGADRLADATALATTDPSVVQGLFTVDVRPWNVMFTG
jgi:uncharacterized protein YciI/uncharacterized protein YndB with AHSA1/START domain